MEKYDTAGQATDDNVAHALCVLDKLGYRHILGICNTYCFSKVTILHERASMLRYTYIACLVYVIIFNVSYSSAGWAETRFAMDYCNYNSSKYVQPG